MNKILFLVTKAELKEVFVSEPHFLAQDHFPAGGPTTSHYRPISGWLLPSSRPLQCRLMSHVTADSLTAGYAVIEETETQQCTAHKGEKYYML